MGLVKKMLKLFDYQIKAISELKTGSILRGGVGSGKTLTSLGYYKQKETSKELYVITTAKKRDELDWEHESKLLDIPNIHVDSWNNIGKYKDVKNAFFIFDEQKTSGYGSWVKSFIKVSKSNNWILLSATPGDKWIDYLPVFIANGFYKNKSDFVTKHVVYNTYTNYPKIDRYVETGKLEKLRRAITVKMDYKKKTIDHIILLDMPYDSSKFEIVFKDKWNPFKDAPIKSASEACYTMRKIVNSNQSRLNAIKILMKTHHKIMVFYNFNYELDLLRTLKDDLNVSVAEYNGQKHESIPVADRWLYLAQYTSAGESWNCIETNTIVLYSRNYSYRQTIQAMGRIDRQNTTFVNLYYYFLTSNSPIDNAILKTYSEKKNFNEVNFIKK